MRAGAGRNAKQNVGTIEAVRLTLIEGARATASAPANRRGCKCGALLDGEFVAFGDEVNRGFVDFRAQLCRQARAARDARNCSSAHSRARANNCARSNIDVRSNISAFKQGVSFLGGDHANGSVRTRGQPRLPSGDFTRISRNRPTK